MTESRSTSYQFARYPSLAGRHAFVSGGASGIGADLVSHLADQGALVTFVDVDVERGEKHAAARRAGGAEVTFRPCDIRDIPLLQQTIADAAEEYGPVRVLVNNAANDVRTPFEQVDVEQWDNEIAVNVRHHF